jgi:hypothetical protein
MRRVKPASGVVKASKRRRINRNCRLMTVIHKLTPHTYMRNNCREKLSFW